MRQRGDRRKWGQEREGTEERGHGRMRGQEKEDRKKEGTGKRRDGTNRGQEKWDCECVNVTL